MVIGLACVPLSLGFWQLDRAEQKHLRQQRIEQYLSKRPLKIPEIKKYSGNINDLPVSFSGRADNQKFFLLDNKVFNGKVGYQVIKVFEDVATGQHILVNLGWVAGAVNRHSLPQIEDTQIGQVQGQIRNYQILDFVLGEQDETSGWPKRIQRVNPESMSVSYGAPLSSYVVLLHPEVDGGFARKWQPIVMPAEKHTAYAVQWFLLALAFVCVVAVVVKKQGESGD